jgi:hypothetical protein
MPPIYHFTDIDNLKGIFEAGELRCYRVAPTAVDVGNQSIKANRSRRLVNCGPRGMVGDYVPFYYAPRSPMLFSIKCGNVEGVSPDQRRLVYLVTSTEAIYSAGLACVMSDGNAATMITKFGDDPEDLDMEVDWELMKERIWRNTPEDPDRVRRRMAEFLVHEAVPLELISGVAVINTQIRKFVASLATEHRCETTVAIRPNWYS